MKFLKLFKSEIERIQNKTTKINDKFTTGEFHHHLFRNFFMKKFPRLFFSVFYALLTCAQRVVTRGIRVEYAWNTRRIRVEYAWNTRRIRVEYA